MTETTIPYDDTPNNPTTRPPATQPPPHWDLIDITIEPGFDTCSALWRHTTGTIIHVHLTGTAAQNCERAREHPNTAIKRAAARAIASLTDTLLPNQRKDPTT